MPGRTFFGPARAAFGRELVGTVFAVVGRMDPVNRTAQLREAWETLK